MLHRVVKGESGEANSLGAEGKLSIEGSLIGYD
jgi:hypothetical protein